MRTGVYRGKKLAIDLERDDICRGRELCLLRGKQREQAPPRVAFSMEGSPGVVLVCEAWNDRLLRGVYQGVRRVAEMEFELKSSAWRVCVVKRGLLTAF